MRSCSPGELSENGWYLPVFHGPGIEKLLGAGVAYEDANRAYDTCVYPEDYPAYEALYDLTAREVGVPAELTYRLRGLDGRTRWVRERSVLRQRRSRTDALTDLFNRRHIVDSLHAELERARRDGHPPGVLMVDLDQFKSVNDVYGHAAGDAVLRAVARRLGSAVRRYDIVGRWGGEEFCVVVPGISGEQALRRVAETVRAAIAGAPVEIPDGRLLRVTASVGGALACEGLWSVEAIVDAAIPDRVLVKPGLLDEEEWEVMRTHSEAGERIVNRIAGLAQAAPIVRHHHERMDGTGYPDGLQGDEIPIEARIVAVADAYSALTTDRVYRTARSSEDAIAVLQATSGAHHDPRCIEALVAVLAERAAYRRRSLVR